MTRRGWVRRVWRWTWPTMLIIVTGTAIGASFLTLQARIDSLSAAVHNRNVTIEQKDRDLTALLDQYTKLYQDCKATSCGSNAPAPSVVKEVLPSTPGPPGAQGATGRPPTSAEVLNAVVGYCQAHAECRGAMGANGQNGSDSTVPGPAGPQGPPGPAGADSTVPGPTGPAGPPGANGADGQPPTSWTYTDALGGSHTCTRATPFDPSSPTYSCT